MVQTLHGSNWSESRRENVTGEEGAIWRKLRLQESVQRRQKWGKTEIAFEWEVRLGCGHGEL